MVLFKLQYKLPAGILTEEEERKCKYNAMAMAATIRDKVQHHFTGQPIGYEVAPFDYTIGMPDFLLTATVIDNNDRYRDDVISANYIALEIMKSLATTNQEVVSAWHRVKGILTSDDGLIVTSQKPATPPIIFKPV